MTRILAAALFAALSLAPLVAQAQTPDHPVRVSGGVMAGLILTRPTPVYPPIARAAHVSGAVVLHAIIGKDGHIQNLTVVSGPQMLWESTMDAVRQWTYRPYLLNGEPVEVDTTIAINVQFGGDSAPPLAGSGPNQAVADKPIGPVRIAGGIIAGNIIEKVAPIYPPEAKAALISGKVVMHAIISKDGIIDHLTVISGPDELRDAATDAVSQWRYNPYLLNGVPTEVDTTITVNFNLGTRPPQP